MISIVIALATPSILLHLFITRLIRCHTWVTYDWKWGLALFDCTREVPLQLINWDLKDHFDVALFLCIKPLGRLRSWVGRQRRVLTMVFGVSAIRITVSSLIPRFMLNDIDLIGSAPAKTFLLLINTYDKEQVFPLARGRILVTV